MWSVRERPGVRSVIEGAPQAIQKKYDLWLATVRAHGPQGLQAVRGFRDKGLKGDLAGVRESRLSDRYRVIYVVDGKFLVVDVVEVTPDHKIRYRP
jgi:addiction module RelE/StbE family toxin